MPPCEYKYETKNKIRRQDLENLVRDNIFDCFKNKTILITGATGLIGSEIVLSFLCANRVKNFNTRVVAHVRNLNKAKEVFNCVINNPDFEIIVQDVVEPLEYKNKVDYIIHCASVTASKEMVNKPVDCILTSFEGTKNILNFAKENNVKSTCYLSSIEAYGNVVSDELIKEDFLGALDLTNPRSSYPESKRMAENLCASYSTQYNVNVKIARLTQTFGAGVNKEDNRVFAQFAKSAINKENIILHTDGASLKSYCYLTDAISAILTILVKGKNANIYNVANKNTAISIKDMANLVAEKYNLKVEYLIDNTKGYPQNYKIKLDTKKLESLGWGAKVALDEMFERLIKSLKEENYEF